MDDLPVRVPSEVDALVREAVGLRRAGDLEGAAQRLEAALARDPAHAGALTSFAMLLLATGESDRAVSLGRRAVAADPARIAAQHVLGQALCRAGALAEGIDRLRRAAALDPDGFAVRVHLGNALAEAGDLAGGVASLLEARARAPDVAAVHVSLGNVYRRLHRPVDAIAAFTRASELDPRLPQALNNLGTVRSEGGDAEGAIEAFRRALALDPDRPSTWSNLLLALQRSDRVTTAELVEASVAFGRHFAARVERLPAVALANPRGRRLRIGYVSSDFVSHAAAVFLEPLLAHHDRARFTVVCYHTAHANDAVTARLATFADDFVAAGGDSDAALAARIRRDAIDILVDLNGHTAGNRLLAFAMKPAPVQLTWLGYLGTTGLAAMDYRLTDAVADPPGRTEAQHVEKLWRLPDSLWCYRPHAFAPAVAAPPCLRKGHVTFGSLAHPGKVSPAAVALWSRVLAAVPDSRLLLVGMPLPERAEALERLLAAGGVAPERIERRPMLSTSDYLALYGEVDIALDTLPYSGGTTTCDALWMGVPVITLAGERSVLRSAASILATAGLNILVTESAAAYVERAATLASDRRGLQAWRGSMRDRLQGSALLDGQRFARAVETAYEGMAEAASLVPPGDGGRSSSG